MNRLREIENIAIECLVKDVDVYLKHINNSNKISPNTYSDTMVQVLTDIYCSLSEALNVDINGRGIGLLREQIDHIITKTTCTEFVMVETPSDHCLIDLIILRIRMAREIIEKYKLNKTYFISGHRDITQEEFDKYYKPSILKVIDTDYTCKFVVGDYHGVDTMAQQLLSDLCNERPHKIKPRDVTVYHMFEKPRNFVNEKFNIKGGYTSDEERDAAMTNESDEDIAFVRYGKYKSGTAQNIVRRHSFK